ncbi:MAG: DUF2807 domain-containing protein [Candidatus Aminicenantes bacterium]|nr:DUF2807 domain-containing protein [Candidatus Aminicenantes bacterium]
MKSRLPKNFRVLSFAGLTLFLLLCSCRPFSSICGSGNIIEETRTVPYFHSIELKTSCTLTFIKGGPQELRIQAEDNILPIITTNVRHDGTLVIDTCDGFKSYIGIKVFAVMEEVLGFTISTSADIKGEVAFSCPSLKLVIGGSGSINIADVTTDSILNSINGSGGIFLTAHTESMDSTINGSGGIHLSGNGTSHSLRTNGSGNLEALDFDTLNYDIAILGSGDCRIFVRDILDADIIGSGSIFYKGNPGSINCNISGSGKLIKMD